jgi:signal transduction histidine kinase
MLSLLDILTDTSKVALGSLDLRLGNVDLGEVVRSALSHFPPDAVARTTLHVTPGSGLMLQGDAARLERVVSNLLGNAFKYSPADSAVEVTLSNIGDTVTLQVQDHGIGIEPNELPHIFSRYSRAQNAVAGGAEGQGLGLYLCWGIVQAHGGRIWAESPGLDQGTTITVALPTEAYTASM